MGAGRCEEAIDAYRQAIALRPGHAESHANLGNALESLGRIDEAIAAYRRAIALRPDDPEAIATSATPSGRRAGSTRPSPPADERSS